jgi:hypothetical protein
MMLSRIVRIIGAAIALVAMVSTSVFLVATLLFADSPNENWPLAWAYLAALAMHFGSVAVSFFIWGNRKKRIPLCIVIAATGLFVLCKKFPLPGGLEIAGIRNIWLVFCPLALLVFWVQIRARDRDLPNQPANPMPKPETPVAGQPPRLP